MKETKPDCYKCKHRGTVPGDCHSCCKYPGNKTGMFDMFDQPANNAEKLGIKAASHGVNSGWFMWPVNFDPVWLESCNGFEAKQ